MRGSFCVLCMCMHVCMRMRPPNPHETPPRPCKQFAILCLHQKHHNFYIHNIPHPPIEASLADRKSTIERTREKEHTQTHTTHEPSQKPTSGSTSTFSLRLFKPTCYHLKADRQLP